MRRPLRFSLFAVPLAAMAVAVDCGGATSGVGQPDGSSGGSSGGSAGGSSGGSSGADDSGSPSDANVANDGAPVDAGDLFDALSGVWLIGWSGGLRHYSWVRFEANGQASYLSGSDLPTNGPYWSCSGIGSYTPSQKPSTVFLTFPASCGLAGRALTFDSYYAPTGSPKNATLGAPLREPAEHAARRMEVRSVAVRRRDDELREPVLNVNLLGCGPVRCSVARARSAAAANQGQSLVAYTGGIRLPKLALHGVPPGPRHGLTVVPQTMGCRRVDPGHKELARHGQRAVAASPHAMTGMSF